MEVYGKTITGLGPCQWLVNVDMHMYEGLDGRGGGGSGIYYSLKITPITHLIKILGYSLK